MSAFAINMREEASSWASAYLQFETGKGREGYRSYAFVEDEDDKTFYQQALVEYSSICYLGCGGKSGVIAVYRKLTDEGDASGNLFFVDRDTELEPFEYENDVLRTVRYSWESHVCEAEYVGWLLQRKLSPNLTSKEQNTVESKWQETVRSFSGVLEKHTSLCQTALQLRVSLSMNEVVFWQDAEWSSGMLNPGPNSLNWYEEKVAQAIEAGASHEEIEEKERYYSGTEPLETARGKTLFSILRVFVEQTKKTLKRTSTFQLNSAKAWAETMPHSHGRLNYIQEYASSRLAEV